MANSTVNKFWRGKNQMRSTILFLSLGLAGVLLFFQNFTWEGSGAANGLNTHRTLKRSYEVDALSGFLAIIMPGGRLSLSSSSEGWKVRTIVPENMVSSTVPSKPHRIFLDLNKIHTSVTTIKPSNDNYLQANGYSLGGHSTAAFNASFDENVYRTSSVEDCKNATPENKNFNPLGEYDCYKLLLYGPLENKANKRIPHVATATVAVQSFDSSGRNRIPNPKILLAEMNSKWMPMTYKANGNTIFFESYEMTATADGRFVFMTHLNPRKQIFMFNPRPWDPKSAWTAPVGYEDMHTMGSSVHCFNTKSSANCPASEKLQLKKRYPILAKPLKLPDGSSFKGTNECIYPWISFDGEELFCSSSNKVAFAVVGRRTNWIWNLIDSSGLNRVRSRGGTQGCPEFQKDGGKCIGSFRAQSPGMTSGVWTGWKGLDIEKYGLHKRPDEYILTLTGWKETENSPPRRFIGQVGFKSFMDGHYLGYFPFNELLGEAPTGNDFLLHTSKTPDVSGNFLSAELKGKAKLFHDVIGTESSESKNAQKWAGSSVWLASGGYVAIQPSGATKKLNYTNRLTLEFAVYLNQDLAALGSKKLVLLEKNDALRIIANKHRQLEIQWMYKNKWMTTKKLSYKLEVGKWTHVGFRLRPSSWTLFLNCNSCTESGTAAIFTTEKNGTYELSSGNSAKITTDSPLDQGDEIIKVGSPANTGLSGFIFGMDELKISNVIRSYSEIMESAFSRDVLSDAVPATLAHFDPTGKHLGLNPSELRIPAQLVPYTQNASHFDKLADLGERLFNSTALSINSKGQSQNISCASCHSSNRAFTEDKAVSVGVSKLSLNSPTIINRAFSIKQMSNAVAANILTQPTRPLTNPKEMNADMDKVVHFLRTTNDAKISQEAFNKAFGTTTPVEVRHIEIALSLFMLKQVVGNSPVDKILAGQSSITDSDAILRGMQLFLGKGRCIGCHSGSNFSDELLHDTAISSSFSMKTPTLREALLTSPYFHDGSAASLKDVIKHYLKGGTRQDVRTELIALPLSAQESEDLLAFIENLSASGSNSGKSVDKLQPAGNFFVEGMDQLFYSNGENAYCSYANWDHYITNGGNPNLAQVNKRQGGLPSKMANHGQCWTDLKGLKWSYAGPIPGMNCTQFREDADPHTWHDNYLCWPANKGPNFQFRSWGMIPDQHCIQIFEPVDREGTWYDNYLCSSYDTGLRWSSAGPIPGKTCLAITEPVEPAHLTWNDNYLCY